MKFKKFKFIKYDKKFPDLYKKEYKSLIKILPNSKIEHFGSTSVPGLAGKGIIDIIVSVNKKEIINTRRILSKNKYKFKKKSTSGERLFFEKDYNNNGKIRRVHIHVTWHNSKDWKSFIAVREYLRHNKKAREQYAKLKKQGIKLCNNDGKLYRDYKKGFINKLSKIALKWN